MRRSDRTHRSRSTTSILAVSILTLVACWDGGGSIAPTRFTSLDLRGQGGGYVHVQGELLLSAFGISDDGRLSRVLTTWQSSDPAVAIVEPNGLVRGLAVGEARITVSSGRLSASTLLQVRPRELSIRSDGLRGPYVLPNSRIDAVAVFKDANGIEIPATLEVAWTVSDTSVARLEYPEGPGSRRVRVVTRAAGRVQLTASNWLLRDVIEFSVGIFEDGAALEVLDYTLAAYQGSNDVWVFSPLLSVRALVPGLVVTRVSFPGNADSGAACGEVPLEVGVLTPLFDFQPYSFSWTGAALAADATAPVGIVVRTASGAVVTVSAMGRVSRYTSPQVFDFGTDGFSWLECP